LRDRRGEGEALNNLGEVYKELGKPVEAQQYLERALVVHKAIGNRKMEGVTLSNLSGLYLMVGQPKEARQYAQQALSLHQEVEDRVGEAITRNNLGMAFDGLGQTEEALKQYKTAISIQRDEEQQLEEGTTLCNLGALYFKHASSKNDLYRIALACFLLAKTLFEQVQSPNSNVARGQIDYLRQKVGDNKFAILLREVEPQAYQIVEQMPLKI